MTLKTAIAIVFLMSSIGPVLADDLPPGVPNPIGPDGKETRAILFSTEAYRKEATRLVLLEANRVALKLQLPEEFPITETNARQIYISPFGMAWIDKSIGNVETMNYIYYVSQGNKFSYLEGTHQNDDCQEYQRKFTWPLCLLDTNGAYLLATQWLAAVSMDTKGLNRDFRVIVKTEDEYIHAPSGKFVPVYDVSWIKNGLDDSVASVRLFLPTKTLLRLRVEDAKYILRRPLMFTNLATLLLGTNTPQQVRFPLAPKPRRDTDTPAQPIELRP